MSASPTNANLGLTEEAANSGTAPRAVPQTLPSAIATVPGREALQALLAFSSLHEQIRQRRAREAGSGRRLSTEDVWELEEFVLDEVLQLVAERALAITGADGVAIALAEGDAIICRGSAGIIAPDAGARLDPNSGFSGACFRSAHIIRCDDSEQDPRVNVQACRRLGTRSMVAVPLAGRHSVIGLLAAFSSEAYGFNDSDVRSLKLLAELILAAMRPEEEDRLAEISRRVAANAGKSVEVEEIRAAFPNGQAAAQASPETKEPSPSAPSEAAILPKADRAEKSRPGLMVVLAVLLLAATLGGGLWWKIRHPAQPTPARPLATEPASSQGSSAPATAPSDEDSTGLMPAEKGGVRPRVTGIRHWSSANSSTVVIELQDQVQYEAHRLSDPERIYFDLHGTSLAPGWFGRTIEIKDALLLRVRVAQPVEGVTRVVLETTGASNFSVSLESNPHRLVVEVRKVDTAPQPQAKAKLFPAPEPASAKSVPHLPSPVQKKSAATSTPADNLRVHVPRFRIVLDAGHGGWDLGTVGRKGLLEKDLVLDVVERLGNLIESRLGAEVVYTRQDDTYIALEKRAEIANQSQADLFLSIHANYSSDASARGVETYYTNTYSSVHARTREADDAAGTLQNVSWTNVDIREKAQESRRFAISVQRALYGMLAAKNAGIRNRGVKAASYVVLTGTSMPAVLAEISFVSSPADEKNLQSSDYRQRIAEALYKGLTRYVTQPRPVKIATASGRPAGR